MGLGTSLSVRMRSADLRAWWAAIVRRAGWPGPEPTRRIRGFSCWEGGGEKMFR